MPAPLACATAGCRAWEGVGRVLHPAQGAPSPTLARHARSCDEGARWRCPSLACRAIAPTPPQKEPHDMKTHPLIAAALLVTTSCATAGKDTAIGAGGGGLVGAGIGALLGGGKGAIIGAGVGALAGGSVGLYLDKQRKDLEAIAETKRTENGVIVNMKSEILFETGSAVLKPEAVAQVEKVGEVLAKYSDD